MVVFSACNVAPPGQASLPQLLHHAGSLHRGPDVFVPDEVGSYYSQRAPQHRYFCHMQNLLPQKSAPYTAAKLVYRSGVWHFFFVLEYSSHITPFPSPCLDPCSYVLLIPSVLIQGKVEVLEDAGLLSSTPSMEIVFRSYRTYAMYTVFLLPTLQPSSSIALAQTLSCH